MGIETGARIRMDLRGRTGDGRSPALGHLVLLCAGFLLVLAALFVVQVKADGAHKRHETALALRFAAEDAADNFGAARLSGASPRSIVAAAAPGPRAAAYFISDSGDMEIAAGDAQRLGLAVPDLRQFELSVRGAGTLTLPGGKVALAWAPATGGGTLVVAAPAAGLTGRAGVWAGYLIVYLAIAGVTGGLIAAFIMQERTARRAERTVERLSDVAAALERGGAGAWFYDAKAQRLTLTASAAAAAGFDAAERRLTLRELTALVDPEDLRAVLAAVSGEGTGEAEARLRTPDGGWARIVLRGAGFSRDGRRSGVLLAAPSVAEAEARIARLSGLLDASVNSIPDALILWDGRGRIALVNRRLAELLGAAPDAFRPGMTVAEAAHAAGSARTVFAAVFAPKTAQKGRIAEARIGENRWARIVRRALPGGGVAIAAANVTDQRLRARAQKKKELELQSTVEDLERSRRELRETMRKYQIEKLRAEEASRSKSEFLANMSHELRTPLNAINGFSEIMQLELYGPVGDQKYKNYIDDILTSGRHLLELIDDILDMSKIEAGRLRLTPKRVDLERVLGEGLRLLERRAAERGVALDAHIAGAPQVWADARAVKQVLVNLLSNAVKFTPEGGKVTVSLETDLDGATVVVSDTGPGIAPEQLAKLGAPFELIDDHFSKSYRGSGLGLALSKSLMELQNGVLAIASDAGAGTTAAAVFPRRAGARARLPGAIAAHAHVLTEPADAAPATPGGETRKAAE